MPQTLIGMDAFHTSSVHSTHLVTKSKWKIFARPKLFFRTIESDIRGLCDMTFLVLWYRVASGQSRNNGVPKIPKILGKYRGNTGAIPVLTGQIIEIFWFFLGNFDNFNHVYLVWPCWQILIILEHFEIVDNAHYRRKKRESPVE